MQMGNTVYLGGNVIETTKVMRERDPFDFYETDEACVEEYFRQYPLPGGPDARKRIIDVGAGRGVWGRVLRRIEPTATLYAVELQEKFYDPSYDEWIYGDFREVKLPWVDFVVGNPPYKYAEEILHRALNTIYRYGEVILLLRLGFLTSEARYNSLWTKGLAPTSVTVLNTRPSFTGDNKTYPGDFAIFRWSILDCRINAAARINFMTYKRPELPAG
jgi:hypothetical protein